MLIDTGAAKNYVKPVKELKTILPVAKPFVVPISIKKEFRNTILKRKKAFSTTEEALPFNTSVTATIRTIDNEPIYARSYPSLMGVSDFINNEVKQLLKDGIIRPSRSPYNSPTWVVDKKGTDAYGNANKRLLEPGKR